MPIKSIILGRIRMSLKKLLFSRGKRGSEYINFEFKFEINDFEKELFRKDLEKYGEVFDESLGHNDYVFKIGRYCGENYFKHFSMELSLDVPGKLYIYLPCDASQDMNHYNKLKTLLTDGLGFELKNK